MNFNWFIIKRTKWAIYKVNKSTRKANKSKAKCEKVLSRLQKRVKELRILQKKFDSVNEVIMEDLEEYESSMVSLKDSLEGVQSELQISNEITIPGLVQCNKLLLERTSADTTEQVRRQVFNSVNSHAEE